MADETTTEQPENGTPDAAVAPVFQGEPGPELPAFPPSVPAQDEAVYLYAESHARFDLSGMGLPDLVPEGTAYTPQEADTVRTLCRKYRVRFFEEAQ